MTRYWCELAWLGEVELRRGVAITVSTDRISEIEEDVEGPSQDDVRLEGVTLPGFANVHSHAFQRALRGRTHHGPGDFWAWREVMYQAAARLDPDNYYELARATYGEMVEAGICSVGEFHYVHHQPDGSLYDDPNVMAKALLAAAHDAGIRITLLDTAYLWGGMGGDPASHVPLVGAQRRFGDGDVGRWIERVDDLAGPLSTTTSRLGAAIHSVRAVDPGSMQLIGEWARHHNRALHVHVSEQPQENEDCVATFGRTPMELLQSSGVLTNDTTLIHSTHVTEADIELVAGAGAGCCLCPTTERDLADGIARSHRMSAAGIPISLGSDSHALIDPLEEARAVEMNQRVVSLRRGVHSLASLFTMATRNGARALQWDGGALEEGALADFTTISLQSNALAGTDREHGLASVLFAAGPADVDHVVVGGKTVVSDGSHVSFDVAGSLDKAIRSLMAS